MNRPSEREPAARSGWNRPQRACDTANVTMDRSGGLSASHKFGGTVS